MAPTHRSVTGRGARDVSELRSSRCMRGVGARAASARLLCAQQLQLAVGHLDARHEEELALPVPLPRARVLEEGGGHVEQLGRVGARGPRSRRVLRVVRRGGAVAVAAKGVEPRDHRRARRLEHAVELAEKVERVGEEGEAAVADDLHGRAYRGERLKRRPARYARVPRSARWMRMVSNWFVIWATMSGAYRLITACQGMAEAPARQGQLECTCPSAIGMPSAGEARILPSSSRGAPHRRVFEHAAHRIEVCIGERPRRVGRRQHRVRTPGVSPFRRGQRGGAKVELRQLELRGRLLLRQALGRGERALAVEAEL
eukprot:6181089-Pleurochrysis_carterae.AAC.1